MRILISALRYHHGKALGGSTYFENLLASISRGYLDHQVSVCCTAQMESWVKSVAPSTEAILAPAPSNALRKVFNESIVLKKILPAWKPDILFFPFNIMPHASRIPSVLMVHDLVGDFYLANGSPRSMAQSLPVKLMVDYSIRQASHLVCPTEAIKAEIMASKKRPASSITSILEAARPDTASCPDVPDNPEYLLLATGCHNEHKKPQVCIQAFANLKVSHPKTFERSRLVITGATPRLRKRLITMADELNVAGRVTVNGRVPQEELSRLMKNADLVLFPTVYEGFGLGLIEAQAGGKVVLASDIPVLREVAGTSAAFFRPCDDQDLAAKIAALLDDRPRRALLAGNAAIWARRRNWDDHARELLHVLERVAGKPLTQNEEAMNSLCAE